MQQWQKGTSVRTNATAVANITVLVAVQAIILPHMFFFSLLRIQVLVKSGPWILTQKGPNPTPKKGKYRVSCLTSWMFFWKDWSLLLEYEELHGCQLPVIFFVIGLKLKSVQFFVFKKLDLNSDSVNQDTEHNFYSNRFRKCPTTLRYPTICRQLTYVCVPYCVRYPAVALPSINLYKSCWNCSVYLL